MADATTLPAESTFEPPLRRAPEPGAAWNDVEHVILTRRSVRAYRSKQVPEHLVRRVLEAGRYAPSAGNAQPWRFVVVRDRALIDEMEGYVRQKLTLAARYLDYTRPGARAQRWLTELLMRVRPSELHPTPLSAYSAIADGRLGVFHGAPTLIFMLVDGRGVGSPLLDVGIAGQNMVLAAHSFGLGTCWVSFSRVLETSRKFRALLQVQHPYRFASSLALGFPRGRPDGFVPRETHETLWIEGGQSSVRR